MTGAFVNNAFSQGFPARRGSNPLGPDVRSSPAIEDRADRMVRHLAIEVDATPEQQERLRGIVRLVARRPVCRCEKRR